MPNGLIPRKSDKQGYVWLAGELRAAIAAGRIPAGEALPRIRELGPRYGVSRETARRAVKELESTGLVVSKPRHGYCVQAKANDPDRGLPVAFVISEPEEMGQWNPFSRVLLAGLQKAASERGWSLLAVGTGKRSGGDVMQQLRACRAGGMVLDAARPELIELAAAIGLPVVMMDSWEAEMRTDAVVQDSFQGALLAAQHLIDQGHTRIAWVGQIAQSLQSRERFGGAAAAFQAAGIVPPAGFICDASRGDIRTIVRELLQRPDRPTAVLGLWVSPVQELVAAALEQGLRPGKDIEIIGWSEEEAYNGSYRTLFPSGYLPPTMVWSSTELAGTALARLAERRCHPALAPLCIKIPVRLRKGM
jgi:DNA-binding LacI/PurR family transcriptional regulator